MTATADRLSYYRENAKGRILRAAERLADESGGVSTLQVARRAKVKVAEATELIAELRSENRWHWHGMPSKPPASLTPAVIGDAAQRIKMRAIEAEREAKPPPSFTRDTDRYRYEFAVICRRNGWESIRPRFINWRDER